MTNQTENINNLIQRVSDEAFRIAAHLEKTGAVDIESPHYSKVIAIAALQQATEHQRPITREGKADLKNLAHF